MKHILTPALSVLAALALISCIDDMAVEGNFTEATLDESDITDALLAVSINDFTVNSEVSTRGGETPTGDKEIMSEFEKKVDNIWLFQYGADGKLLIAPRYYTAEGSETDGTWDVLLKPDVASTIYVVTNVNSKTWAEDYTEFYTMEQLKLSTLPEPAPLYDLSTTALEGHIPAQGCAEAEVTSGSTVIVPVEHMYAKVKMRITVDRRIVAENEASVGGVYFDKAPWYCRITTLYDGIPATSQDGMYKNANGEDIEWVERPLGSDGEGNNTDDPNNDIMPEDSATYEYVIYVPENIQGEHEKQYESDTKLEIGNNLTHASSMKVVLDYVSENVQSQKTYTVYPGGNNEDNFNIRRNQVYRITLNLGYPIDPDYEPSSNCIVCKPYTTNSFEPYYREETGGGYSFEDYLNWYDSGKMIKGVRILWQTEECIGDNSEGKLVYFRPSSNDLEDQNQHDKIYVTVNKPGNAVIAAYADKECEGDIIWSWHIWVPNEGEDPTNVAKAITYYTYDWDATQIYGENSGRARVPGYGCMPCNLGALSSEPSDATDMSIFGMNYQWGRKDPFPPLIAHSSSVNQANSAQPYTEETVGPIYDNSNTTKVGMTATDVTPNNELFYSKPGTEIETMTDAVAYTIKNPTVFMCGTYEAGTTDKTGETYVQSRANYFNNGSWMPTSEDTYDLWGGTDPNKASIIYTIDEANGVHLCSDYGEKSIFDPCPYGWRVSPPDQWLGFSYTGINPISYAQINTPSEETNGNLGYGMYLYIQSWKSGLTSYFPTPGPRVGNGCGMRGWTCGNYHNATVDTNYTRVNILHIHDQYNNFRIFETVNYMYYVKSVAGPVRCVREIK